MTDIDNKIINKKQLAEYLGMSLSSIDKYVAEKKLPFIKIGNRKSSLVRFRMQEINEWLHQHDRKQIRSCEEQSVATS